jgi:hypothetical protein
MRAMIYDNQKSALVIISCAASSQEAALAAPLTLGFVGGLPPQGRPNDRGKKFRVPL